MPAQGADGGGREGAAALAHLRDTALQLRELAHVQLLADSYRAAQRRAFGAASPPPVRLMPLPSGSSAVPSGSSRVIWPVPLQYLGLSLLPHCYASGFCRPVLTGAFAGVLLGLRSTAAAGHVECTLPLSWAAAGAAAGATGLSPGRSAPGATGLPGGTGRHCRTHCRAHCRTAGASPDRA